MAHAVMNRESGARAGGRAAGLGTQTTAALLSGQPSMMPLPFSVPLLPGSELRPTPRCLAPVSARTDVSFEMGGGQAKLWPSDRSLMRDTGPIC